MKIFEILAEALNQPYPVRWNTKTEQQWFGLAKDGELSIQIKDGSGSGMYGIVFKLNDKLFSPDTGDQFRIFATVVAAVKEWWSWASKNVDVKSIWFSAEKVRGNDSRSKLYSRFAKQFARETGYELKVSTDMSADIYHLKKPQVNENISQRSKIAESLDNPYPFTWTVDEEDEKLAVAEIDRGEKLEIIFEAFDEEHAWEIVFKVDGLMSATDQGDQFRIFATVTKAVKEWLQQMVSSKQPLRQITFRAFKDDEDDISKEKLYGRFAKRISDTIGFKFSKKDYGDEVAFYLDNPNY
jgi:hypothetical protein